MARKGMMVGSGRSGYYNVIPKDPYVHKMSAMGIKQPQRVGVLIDGRLHYNVGTKYNQYWRKSGKRHFGEGLGEATATLVGGVKHFGRNVKKGYKSEKAKGGKYLYTEEDIQFIGRMRGEGKTREEAEAMLAQVKKIKKLAYDYKQRFGGKSSKNLYSEADLQFIGRLRSEGKTRDEAEAILAMMKTAKSVRKMQKLLGGKKDGKELLKEFEQMRNMAELKALSNVSLQRPLSDKEYNKMMSLKKKVFGGKAPPKEFFEGLQKEDKYPFDKTKGKPLKLPIETAIYVPSTYKNQKEISKKEYEKRVKQTERFLHKLLGGFTRIDHLGGSTEKGRLVEETGAKVVSFTDSKTFNSHKRKYHNFIKQKRKEWGQNSIGFENEGDLFHIK